MVVSEVIRFMKTKTKCNDGCVALKLDIRKVYDIMDYDYSRDVIIKMGFND